ncbi:MAG: Spy/CpxP family protein refolding chaperone [Sulfurihydrogenibium sp.]|jgi:Spy/CpxP family protein refolding chaperone|nr:Spy/CpxP family protein refolding chaperone [Sulfurihydrogenibium sp.]
MKKLKVAMLTLTLGIGLIGNSFAMEDLPEKPHQQAEKMPGNYENHFKKLKQKLNLTDEQLNQIKEIKKQEKEEIKNFFAKEYKNPLLEATKSGKFDRKAFQETATENAKEISGIKAKYLEKMFNVLNDQQRQKFIDYTKKKMERMHDIIANH